MGGGPTFFPELVQTEAAPSLYLLALETQGWGITNLSRACVSSNPSDSSSKFEVCTL